MKSVENRPLRIFLCHIMPVGYAKEDKPPPVGDDLYHQLTDEDWLDEIKLLPGQEWDIEIEKAVEQLY